MTAHPPARHVRRRGVPHVSLGQVLLWLGLGLGAVLMIAPFYWTLITSFKPWQEIAAFPPTWVPQTVTLEHWRSLLNLSTGSFARFFVNSVVLSTSITLITLLSSALAGYVFAKHRFRGRNALFTGVVGLIVVPFTVTLVPLYDMMARWGWLNSYAALIVPIVFSPFGIFLMRQFIADLPDELLDAARIDGASEPVIFTRVVLPLSTAPLAALAVFTFVAQWDNFLWPLVILDDPSLYTLPLGLAQFRGRTGIDVGPVAAGSMLAVLPVLLVYFLAQRQFIEGITLSGVKG